MVSGRTQDGSWRGVWPIITTPFDDAGRLDLNGLGSVVEHVLRGGAHGVVYPAIASEFQTLDRDERHAAIERVLSAVAGRRPVIVGVSTVGGDLHPPSLAEAAERLGAAGVMFMPAPRPSDGVASVVAAVAEASVLPIVLQNAPAPLGPTLPVEAIADVIRGVPAIRYVKEEVPPCGQRITRLLEAAGGRLQGVFGGAGGRFVLDELARGASGSMPACEFTNLHVRLYDLIAAGDPTAARRLFNAMLPLLNFESVFRTSATKFILHRMGVIDSTRHRDGNPELDANDRRELVTILDGLETVAEETRRVLDDGRGH
jgi:4-hydroxy-tetrahydrodipicolinate synthase